MSILLKVLDFFTSLFKKDADEKENKVESKSAEPQIKVAPDDGEQVFGKVVASDYLQSIAKKAWESACLFLCYLKWRYRDYDKWMFRAYALYTSTPTSYNKSKMVLEEDFTVNDASAILNCDVSKSTVFPGKPCIAKLAYEDSNGKEHGHWVILNSKAEIIYNPYKESMCVKRGEPVDYRIPSKQFYEF